MEGLGPTLGRWERKSCQEDDAPALWIKSLVCRQKMFPAALAQQAERGGLLSTQSTT